MPEREENAGGRRKLPGKEQNYLFYSPYIISGSGSSVGVVTGYGLDGPGIESRWWRDFPHLFRPSLEPTQHPVQWVPGLSRG